MQRILTAFLLCCFTTSAQAAVLDISFGFAGGELGAVSVDVRLDADLSAGDIAPTTAGLTINSLSVVPAGGLGYRYNAVFDSLLFFGLENDEIILGSNTDFFFVINTIGSTPSIGAIGDSSALMPGSFGNPTLATLSVTPVNTVPLPATGLLLLGGIASVAALKSRKKRTARRQAA